MFDLWFIVISGILSTHLKDWNSKVQRLSSCSDLKLPDEHEQEDINRILCGCGNR